VRAKKIALAVLLPLLLPLYKTNAQWIGEIQTESDWEMLLNQGYIDFNSYQLYRELAEGSVVKDTSEYIQATLGNPPSDIISPANQSIPAFGQDISPRRVYLRSGQRVQNGNNSGYLLLSSYYQGLDVEYKGRNVNSSWESERRNINYTGERFDVAVGNYTANIGAGLGIGRYDYRPLGISNGSINPDFLFPDNSYYNGIKIELDNRYAILQSSKKYLSVRKDLYGGAASIPIHNSIIGLTVGATRLSNRNNHRTLGEGSIFFTNPETGIISEAGYAESGAGGVFEIKKRHYDIRFWHYDRSFINPQSSSMAYSDYITFDDSRFPVSFRQVQTGESGLSIRRNLTLNRLTLVGWITAWKRSPHDPASFDNSLGARLPFGDWINLTARYSERSGRGLNRTINEIGLNINKVVEVSSLVSLWVDGGGVDNARSYAHIYLSIPVRAGFVINARLRSHFDGNLESFVEERTIISNRFSLKATYRWQDSYGSESGPLYLIMESAL
jgi:hypothetical protein